MSESICAVIMKGNNLTRVEMFWICWRRLGYSRVPALSSSRISITIVHVFVSGQRASGIVPSSLGNPGHPRNVCLPPTSPGGYAKVSAFSLLWSGPVNLCPTTLLYLCDTGRYLMAACHFTSNCLRLAPLTPDIQIAQILELPAAPNRVRL